MTDLNNNLSMLQSLVQSAKEKKIQLPENFLKDLTDISTELIKSNNSLHELIT